MHEVIKEFAGIEVGTKREFAKSDIPYLENNGYIKPIPASVKAAKQNRKTKIDHEAEKPKNKAE